MNLYYINYTNLAIVSTKKAEKKGEKFKNGN